MAVMVFGDVNLVARAGIRAGAADKERLAKEGWSGWVGHA
jgi:hypothetical protein